MQTLTWIPIRPQVPGPTAPAAQTLRAALTESSAAFREFLEQAGSADQPVLLLVNDSHRSTQTRATLEVLAEFVSACTSRPRFRAVVAAGTHRFSPSERADFERRTFDGCGLAVESVFWHDDCKASVLRPVGDYRFHRAVAECRCLLPIGSVEPHYFAGLTGAHKTCTIGVAGRAEIERNHRGALHPASDVLALAGNPVHEGIVAMARALETAGKRILAMNQVVCESALVAAAAGGVFETLMRLLPVVRGVYCRVVPRVADVLHLRVPMPLGRSLYQADKALKNNHLAVRDGGGIILEAECPEGIGPDSFMRLLRRASDFAGAVRIVEQEGYRLGDHKAIKLRWLTDPACRGVRVALVTRHVPDSAARVAGMRSFEAIEPAMAWIREQCGALQTGYLIEDAGMMCVRPREDVAG